MTLYELAQIVRSKNAGPFTLTVDLFFESPEDMARALSSPALAPESVAELYHVPAHTVAVHAFEPALAIKVRLPRPSGPSGSPGDRDVYGSQQHFPLAGVEV